MIYKVYAYKDTMTEFMAPILANNEHVARRNFKVIINQPGSELGMIAENIELWQVGEYDTTTGRIKGDLKYICKGYDVKEVEK